MESNPPCYQRSVMEEMETESNPRGYQRSVMEVSVTAKTSETADQRRPMEQVAELEVARPMGDDPIVPQEVHEHDDMLGLEDRQWSPACTHMATPDDEDERLASGVRTHTHTYIRRTTGHQRAHT